MGVLSHLEGQVAGGYHHIERQSYGSRNKGCQQGVGDGVTEDAPRVPAVAQRGQCRGDGQHDGWHGQQLEQPRIDHCHEVGYGINSLNL